MPKRISEPTECSDLVLAYLAGIIDGEGCIGLYAGSGGRDRGLTLSVTVMMCEPAAVIILRRVFGGSLRPMSTAAGGIRPHFQWTLKSRMALACLERLLPYLIVKAPQALLAIEFNRVRSSIGHRCGRRPFSDGEVETLTALATQMRALKRVPATLDS